MVIKVEEQAKEMGEEIDMDDGFDLYRQFSGLRRIFMEKFPEYETLRKNCNLVLSFIC